MYNFIKFVFKYMLAGMILAISALITGVLIVKAVWGLNATSWETLTTAKWNELVDKVAGVVTSGWNVGIGTYSPQAPLHINGPSNNYAELVITDTASAGIEIRSSGTDKNMYIDFADTSTDDSGNGAPDYQGRIKYEWFSNTMQFYTNTSNTPSIVINSASRVGINTGNPLTPIHIKWLTMIEWISPNGSVIQNALDQALPNSLVFAVSNNTLQLYWKWNVNQLYRAELIGTTWP